MTLFPHRNCGNSGHPEDGSYVCQDSAIPIIIRTLWGSTKIDDVSIVHKKIETAMPAGNLFNYAVRHTSLAHVGLDLLTDTSAPLDDHLNKKQRSMA
jgi:hypothetical protein